MSARRNKITEILSEVVPSYYPDAKFKKLDAVWKPGAGYTTCGALPTYVAKGLGVAPTHAKDGLLDYGLISMRNAAIRAGCWHHQSAFDRMLAKELNVPKRRPQPGDFYMLCSGDKHETGCNRIGPVTPAEAAKQKPDERTAFIEHVGVILNSGGTKWLTSDAGQSNGDLQCAVQVWRDFDPATGFMTGERGREGKPMRRLCGWLDVDSYPFLT